MKINSVLHFCGLYFYSVTGSFLQLIFHKRSKAIKSNKNLKKFLLDKMCTMFWTWCNMEHHFIHACYMNMLAVQYHIINKYQSSYCIELLMHFNDFTNAISYDDAEFQEHFTPTSYYADLGKSARVWKCTVTLTPHHTYHNSNLYSIQFFYSCGVE